MKRILIVEDDRKIALALGVRLRASGYQTILANEALEGVTMAVEHLPDLIISDIMMPLGGGLSILDRLQKLPTTATIPSILITASREPGLKEKAEELGAVGYFEKPFDTEKLLAAVKSVLGDSTDQKNDQESTDQAPASDIKEQNGGKEVS